MGKLVKVSVLVVGLVLVSALQASAGLLYDSSIILSAQGFGNANKDLTVQDPNPLTPPGEESGCVSWSGGAIVIGSTACQGVDAANAGNTIIPTGGDEPPPLADNQKYGAPLENDLGLTSAADIGVLFNATEPSGDLITLTDLTIKFFNGNTLIGSIDLNNCTDEANVDCGPNGSISFLSSQPGVGSAGFVFVVSPDEYGYVNGLLAQGNIRMTLESTLNNASGGEETFLFANIHAPAPIPEPTSMLLLGSGLVGLAARVRSRNKK